MSAVFQSVASFLLTLVTNKFLTFLDSSPKSGAVHEIFFPSILRKVKFSAGNNVLRNLIAAVTAFTFSLNTIIWTAAVRPDPLPLTILLLCIGIWTAFEWFEGTRELTGWKFWRFLVCYGLLALQSRYTKFWRMVIAQNAEKLFQCWSLWQCG